MKRKDRKEAAAFAAGKKRERQKPSKKTIEQIKKIRHGKTNE
jgi:hypothetical protein